MKSLSVAEVALKLGISVEKVTELVGKGEIIAIEIGGFGLEKKILVTEGEVDKYLEKAKSQPKTNLITTVTPITHATPKKVVFAPAKSLACTTPRGVAYTTTLSASLANPNDRILISFAIAEPRIETECHYFYTSYLKNKNFKIKDVFPYFKLFKEININEYRMEDLAGSVIISHMYLDFVTMHVSGIGKDTVREIYIVLEKKISRI